MPLNSHSYLVGQGWQGTGKALRDGAISRPVVIAQKKSLAGVGKDRDEAYPFWDHVFAAAAISIKAKLYKDDEDADTPQPSGSVTPIDRTSTGIISNKPQKVGLSVLDTLATSKIGGMSVAALAKRESAKRGLYSRFFRGPVLGSDTEERQVLGVTQRPPRSCSEPNDPNPGVSITEQMKGKKRKSREEGEEEARLTRKKRKPGKESETKEERKERRRSKKLKREVSRSDAGLDGKTESGSAKKPLAPEVLVRGHDVGDRPRRESCKKRGKRKGRESSVCYDG